MTMTLMRKTHEEKGMQAVHDGDGDGSQLSEAMSREMLIRGCHELKGPYDWVSMAGGMELTWRVGVGIA